MNSKTTLLSYLSAFTDFLTILAALPYTLGEIGLIIPPEWKSKVVAVGLIASVILKVIRGHAMKDKEQPQDGLDTSSIGSKVPTISLVLIFLVPALMLQGCAISDANKDKISSAWGSVYNSPLARQVAIMAGKAALQAVAGASKSDWLNSAAINVSQGLEDYERAKASEIKNAIVESTPAQRDPGYEELAQNIANLFVGSKGAPAEKAQQVAAGLQAAAAQAK